MNTLRLKVITLPQKNFTLILAFLQGWTLWQGLPMSMENMQNSKCGIPVMSLSAILFVRVNNLPSSSAAGCSKYRAPLESCCNHVCGVVLVYSVMNRASFDACPGWIEEVRPLLADGVPLMLLGSKTDLSPSIHLPHKVFRPVTLMTLFLKNLIELQWLGVRGSRACSIGEHS